MKRIWLLALLFAVVAGLLGPQVAGLIEALGYRIPNPDMASDYLQGLAWAAALLASLSLWPVPARDRRALALIWLAKIGVTLGFMLIYEYAYGLDSYFYFSAPQDRSFVPEAFRLGEGTNNILRLVYWHYQLMPPSFHALKVSCAMLGLLAIYLFYRAGVLAVGREDRRILYVLAFTPSILFWSSILGKDPVMLVGIAMYALGAVTWLRRGRWWAWALIAGGIVLAMGVRTWMGPIMLAPLGIVLWPSLRHPVTRGLAVVIMLPALLFSVQALLDQFRVETLSEALEATGNLSQSWAHGGSGQVLDVDFTSPRSVISFLPWGMFTALFRPLPLEVRNPFGLLAGAENAALLWLLFLALRRGDRARLRDPVVLWALVLVITWALVYSFISYQNLGSAVRFRLQILPVLLGLLLYLGWRPAPTEVRS